MSKMKKNNHNNCEYVNYFNKLKSQQLLLEKHENCIVSFIKNNLDFTVEDEYVRMNDAREQEICKVECDVRDLCDRLKQIKATVKKENLEHADVTDLGDKLTALQSNVNQLKNYLAASTGSLKSAENKLTTDVQVAQVIIDEINGKPNRLVRSAPAVNSTYGDAECQEIKDLVNFVNKSGGREGGWTPDDHLLFMKYYNRYRTPSKCMPCLLKLFPDKSEGDVIEHFEWYEKYLELRAKQKRAIAEWKKSKAENGTNEARERGDQKPPERRPKSDDRREIKEKIQKWKVEKEERKRETPPEEVSRLAAEKERRRREAWRRKKLEIEHWRNDKRSREEQEKREKELSEKREKEQRVALANRMIREFQYLDWFYVRKRRETYLAAKLREFDARIDEAPGSWRPRDPGRLLQPTKQWLARTAPDAEPGGGTRFSAQVKHIGLVPKLATPDWRKTIA